MGLKEVHVCVRVCVCVCVCVCLHASALGMQDWWGIQLENELAAM